MAVTPGPPPPRIIMVRDEEKTLLITVDRNSSKTSEKRTGKSDEIQIRGKTTISARRLRAAGPLLYEPGRDNGRTMGSPPLLRRHWEVFDENGVSRRGLYTHIACLVIRMAVVIMNNVNCTAVVIDDRFRRTRNRTSLQ